jgi:hypothetical protein
MSVSEWQVSLVSALLGTAAGAIISYAFVLRQENGQKKRIRRALVAELSIAKETLKEALQKGEHIGAGEVLIDFKLPVCKLLPVDISNFKGIEFENLVKSLDIDILNSVKRTYRMIDRHNDKMKDDAAKRSTRVGHDVRNFIIEEDEVKVLIQQIEKTINEINRAK